MFEVSSSLSDVSTDIDIVDTNLGALTLAHDYSPAQSIDPIENVGFNRPATIWNPISEPVFRTNLVTLERHTNAVPLTTQVFSYPVWKAKQERLKDYQGEPDEDSYKLSASLEQQLADDFAFLSATGQGAQSVSAVCIEQDAVDQNGLTLRFAAVDVFTPDTRVFLSEMVNVIQKAASCVNTERQDFEARLFELIIQAHYSKILGRLRSSKWVKPVYLARTHKKPLHEDFTNVIHRIKHTYPQRSQRSLCRIMTECLTSLHHIYLEFETLPMTNELEYIGKLVTSTYETCLVLEVQHYAQTLFSLDNQTPQIGAVVKTLHQLQKIGAYKRIAQSLITAATDNRKLFRKTNLAYLSPYPATTTHGITYEPWAKTCHVHAEVQLIVYYDTHRQTDFNRARQQTHNRGYIQPRIIGTSKYLCYLCYLFMKHHGHFFPPNTHGRLYDQWTIPDSLDCDNALREKYTSIIGKMNAEVMQETKQIVDERGEESVLWRVEPMTSRQDLLSYSGLAGSTEVQTLEQA